MPTIHQRFAFLVSMVLVAMLLAGCNSPAPPTYRSKEGFRFTPPHGWVERAKDDLLPAKPGHTSPDLPLPRIGVSGEERLLIRYDRLTAGHLAWIRVTIADIPSSTALDGCVSACSPASSWKRESNVEVVEISGRTATRIAFEGRWKDQEYINETVAVRQGDQVYFLTASFPASDIEARAEVRKAVAGATWP
jgi:hypothetical protein